MQTAGFKSFQSKRNDGGMNGSYWWSRCCFNRTRTEFVWEYYHMIKVEPPCLYGKGSSYKLHSYLKLLSVLFDHFDYHYDCCNLSITILDAYNVNPWVSEQCDSFFISPLLQFLLSWNPFEIECQYSLHKHVCNQRFGNKIRMGSLILFLLSIWYN